MNPHTRAAWALGISLAIWFPVALGVLGNHIDAPTGALYYLGALAIAWVGTGIISHLTGNYRETLHRVERAKRRIEQLENEAREAAGRDGEDHPRRRSTD